MKDQILELENKIIHHKELYYKGHAEISDEDYDKLEAKLKKLAPNSPVLQIVGASVTGDNKVAHDSKMLSLDKCYEVEKLLKWQGKESLVSTFKYDGSSCSLVYKDGVYVEVFQNPDNYFEYVEQVFVAAKMKDIYPTWEEVIDGELGYDYRPYFPQPASYNKS